MKQIRESLKKTRQLHHAYCLEGEREGLKKELLLFLEKDLDFVIAGNPDFWQKDFGVLKIDDCREIIESQLKKPVETDKKIFIISANFITRGAQNSLLKIFEEPSAQTHFFLLLPTASFLLPTLRSRLMILSQENKSNTDTLSSEDFLNSKIGKRLEITAKMVKDIKDEKKTKADVIAFVKGLENIIALKKNSIEKIQAIESLEKAISYLNDESPSVKVILDYLMVVLPSSEFCH